MNAPRIVGRNYTDATRFATETLGLAPRTFRVITTVGGLAGYGYTLHLAPGWSKAPYAHALRNKIKFKRNIEVIDHEATVQKESTREVETTPSPFGEIVEGGCPTCGEDAYADADPDSETLYCANDACPDYDPATYDVAPAVEPEKVVVDVDLPETPEETADDQETDDKVAPDPEPTPDTEPEPDPEEPDAETGTKEPGEDAEGSENEPKRRRRRCKTCGILVEPDDVEAHAAEHEEG